MRACGGVSATVCRSPISSYLHAGRTCYYFTVILLLSIWTGTTIRAASSLEISTVQTGSSTQSNAWVGLPKATSDNGNDSAPSTTGGAPPSLTGDQYASLDTSTVQTIPKSLELLLRPGSTERSSDNEVSEELANTTQASQSETSQRANTVVTSSPATTTTTTAATTLSVGTTATSKPLVSGPQNSQSPQTKSLKFTLIAGKSWKFIIKGNSLSSHNKAELRLHKNVSTNNYIIDDEGWFQYNPQQQQLFAWPSLETKSGTYYFVLLPSGIDFEADSENIVNLEVAASIVVELIKPLYQGTKTGDVHQLVDYEFSLEQLHRHPTYPLLLNQIFSVFETLAKSNATTTTTTTQIVTSSTNLLTTISPSNQQVASRSSNKLSEYLLLAYNYSPDGELFSVHWSTHPALVNNTLTPIGDCRVNTIIDTISKLSSRSAGYHSDEEKFTILYGLEAPSSTILSNSHAIVPTERSNALKLTLNGPCQKAKIVGELGIQQQVGKVVASVGGGGAVLSADVSNVENNNSADDRPATSTVTTKSLTNSFTTTPNGPDSEALVTNTANQTTLVESSTLNSTSQIVKLDETTPSQHVISNQPRSISERNSTQQSPGLSTETSVSSPALSAETESLVTKTTTKAPLQQQPKLQPQAKSLEDFLEMSDNQPSSTPTNTVPELSSTPPSNFSSPSPSPSPSVDNVETTTLSASVSTVSTRPVTPVSAESTLNEDFMGILDEVMNYLVSVAVPASIIVGSILLISIIFALCHLYRKRKKSKEFQVRNRFDFRYSSERKGFLKNSSRPVILEADQKSLSTGGTPQHKAATKDKKKKVEKNYYPMTTRNTADNSSSAVFACTAIDGGGGRGGWFSGWGGGGG